MPNYTNHPKKLTPEQALSAIAAYYATYPHPTLGPVRPTIQRLAQLTGVSYHTMWRTLVRNRPQAPCATPEMGSPVPQWATEKEKELV